MSSQYLALNFGKEPRPLYTFTKEYAESDLCPNSNFLKGLKWAPDGSCLLTVSEDKIFRLFNLPSEAYQIPPTTNTANSTENVEHSVSDIEASGHNAGNLSSMGSRLDPVEPFLRISEAELVYDFDWYPYMSSSDPQTCCFASTSRSNPIHLWDACTGKLRGSYRSYNGADEITAALCVRFSADGSELYAGFNKMIRVFDVTRPGRDCDAVSTSSKKKRGQPGLLSCIDFSPLHDKLFVVGSYLGTVGMYSKDDCELNGLLEGHSGGVTQVSFSKDGCYVYSGARRDPSIVCWDVRYTKQCVYVLERATFSTTQRIQFSIEPCGRHLATGGQDGAVRIFDLSTGECVGKFQAASDVVNSVMLHPQCPIAATGSGRRKFDDPVDLENDCEQSNMEVSTNGSLCVWQFDSNWVNFDTLAAEGEEDTAGQ